MWLKARSSPRATCTAAPAQKRCGFWRSGSLPGLSFFLAEPAVFAAGNILKVELNVLECLSLLKRVLIRGETVSQM